MTAKVIEHGTGKEVAFICECKNAAYDWRSRKVTITDEYDNDFEFDLKIYDVMVLAK